MSTGSSITDIHVAHSEPAVSAMMRRINAMMDRGIKAIERRMQAEKEARIALRETQQLAEQATIGTVKVGQSARDSHMRHTIMEITSGRMTCAQAHRKFGYRKFEMRDFARENGIKVNREIFEKAGGSKRGLVISMIQDDRTNAHIMDETGIELDFIQKIRREITGKSENMLVNTKSDRILQLFRDGKTPAQIVAEVNTARCYVMKILRDHGAITAKVYPKADTVRDLIMQGMTIDAIASQVNCSRNYVFQVRHAMGIKSNRKSPTVLADQAKRALGFAKQGMTLGQIAIAMERTERNVRKYLAYGKAAK